jgi:hypothetical protein
VHYFHFVATFFVGSAIAVGCSSNPTAGDGGSDATAEASDLCSQFTSVGDPCPRVSAQLCFPECTNGGCKCVAGSNGPVWQCTTDTSCMPCSAPLDDASVDCGSDGSVMTEAGSDASSDAGDDASADAAQE